ncbi:MAG: hypothetical protein AAF789_02530 [Bacteroidota bacterium]
MSIVKGVKQFVLVIALALLLSQCGIGELEFDNLEVQPIGGVFVFPLGTASYTIGDLIEEQSDEELDLQQDESGFFTFLYFDSLSYTTETEFVEFPDIVQNTQVDLDAFPAPATESMVQVSRTFDDFSYQPVKNERVDEITYATGNLSISVTTAINAAVQVDYELTIPSTVDDNNDPVAFTGNLGNQATDNQTRSLVDHVTTLTSNNGQNNFTVAFESTITVPAGLELTTDDNISIIVTYQNQTFSLVRGFFGQDTAQVGNETLDLDFFQDFGDGFFFGNPKITFDFRNQFGIPFSVDFSSLTAVNGANTATLDGEIVTNRPVVDPAANPGETQQTIIEINNSNSSLAEMLSISPQQLILDIEGFSNAEEPVQSNFIQPNSTIEGFATLEIPMEIRLVDLEQEIYFSLGNGLDTVDIDSAFIRIVTVNSLPMSGLLTLEVQDEDSTVLYTAADNPVLKAPFINVSGGVDDPGGTFVDVPLSPEGIGALAQGSFLILRVVLNTPETLTSRDIFVRLNESNNIFIRVGIGVKLNREI